MTDDDGIQSDDSLTPALFDPEDGPIENESVAPEVVQQEPELNMLTVSASMSSSFAGPLPPPTALAMYEEVVPGAADRIIAMAERQSEHRQSMEAMVVGGNVNAQRRSPIIGAILVLAALGVAVVAILNDYPIIGFGTFFVSFASVVGVTISARKKQDHDIQSRHEDEDDEEGQDEESVHVPD